VARRLTPEARRAEIIEVAHAVITEEGYNGLSLRELARRCEMSAPGLMHYFPDMRTLLEAVLAHRDEQDLAAIGLSAEGDQPPLGEMIERGLRYYEGRPDETRSFDALEIEALDPTHPAHEFFVHRDERNIELLRPYVEREFADPDAAMRMLRIVFDGLWLRWIREPDVDHLASWREVEPLVFAGLERRVPGQSDRVS
jgi:AcrR family transcriptional regulator